MITTGFNAYQPRISNNNVRPRQNNVAFEAKFSDKLYKDLKDGEDYAYNDATALVQTGIVRAKDGALVQAKKLLEGDPDNEFFQNLVKWLEDQK